MWVIIGLCLFISHRDRDSFSSYFKGNTFRVVDKHPIPSVGQIKGYVFVGLFTTGSAITVPDIDYLPVFHKGSKSLTESNHEQLDLTRIRVLQVRIDGL